jgi:hypothetical protein
MCLRTINESCKGNTLDLAFLIACLDKEFSSEDGKGGKREGEGMYGI